jgi:hypothetical protein
MSISLFESCIYLRLQLVAVRVCDIVSRFSTSTQGLKHENSTSLQTSQCAKAHASTQAGLITAFL